MEHRRVCFCMLSLLPLVQISKLSQANSLLFGKVCCRTPRGVRGLKSVSNPVQALPPGSHPSRGAWIGITVDDHAIVQHLPDYETAYHAGDGKDGPGNATSIGIEICVNAGGDFEAAKANAAALVRLLMKEHGIPLDNVVQHNHWNGKDCPKTIRATPRAWEAFLGLCRGEAANVSKLDTDVDTLANVGIIDQPDYWKAGNYSKDTVEALIGKTADYVREDD